MIDRLALILYVAVIAMAFTLPEAWMIGSQAAIGGFGLGSWATRQARRFAANH